VENAGIRATAVADIGPENEPEAAGIGRAQSVGDGVSSVTSDGPATGSTRRKAAAAALRIARRARPEVRKLAAVLDGDALRDGEAKPRAVRLRGGVRLEEPCGDLVRHAGTVVGHGDGDVRGALGSGEDDDGPAAVLHRVDGILKEVRQDLHDLVAVGANRGKNPRSLLPHRDLVTCRRSLELDDLTNHLIDVDLLRARGGEPRESRELRDDVADAVNLVEDRPRGLVEVVVERGIVARAQASESLDCGADRREGVLHFVGDAARHLTPRGDATGRRETPTRRSEIFEHLVEGLAELGELARAAYGERARLIGRDLASLARKLLERPTDAPSEEHRQEERDPGRGEGREKYCAVDPREVVVERRLRLGDHDGQ